MNTTLNLKRIRQINLIGLINTCKMHGQTSIVKVDEQTSVVKLMENS